MVPEFATVEQKRELCLRLALLYLEKSDISGVSPTDLAKRYYEVKEEISRIVNAHP